MPAAHVPFRLLGAGGGHEHDKEAFEVAVCDDPAALRTQLPKTDFAVDFSTGRVVVIRASCADTSWSLVVREVERDDHGDVIVSFSRISSGGVALQMITRPWIAIAIPRSGGRVIARDESAHRGHGGRERPALPAHVGPPVLVARWRQFDGARYCMDETNRYTAENLGMVAVSTAAGDGLAWRADGQALRIPESLLDGWSAGAIVFRLMREIAGTPFRLFGKVDPGVRAELGVHIDGNDRCTFVVSQGQPLAAPLAMPIGEPRQLVCAWGPDGKRILCNGALLAKDDERLAVGYSARVIELGRDPNNPVRTGSRGILLELAMYEGYLSADSLVRLSIAHA